MNNKKVLSIQFGYTIIEFLIASFILSVGILGLFRLQIYSVRHLSSGRWRILATYIARGILEQVQMECKQSINAKHNDKIIKFEKYFTIDPGNSISVHNFAFFNANGLLISGISNEQTTNKIDQESVNYKNSKKPNLFFKASWSRSPNNGYISFSHSDIFYQLFCITVSWDENGMPKKISLTRCFQY